MTIQSPTRTTSNGLVRRHDTVTFVQTIDPAEAEHMVTTMRYENQRPLRERKVQEYADEMLRGAFRELTQIFIAIYHGRHVILDGQHRLSAVIRSGTPHVFTIVEKEVDTEEELARIYSTTDIGARRTSGDIYGAYALAEEFGLTKSNLDRLGAAVKFMLTGCVRTGEQFRHDAVIPLMRLYAPYMRQYISLVGSGDSTRPIMIAARRSSTVTAALLTLRFSAPKAEREGRPPVINFWVGVFTDDGLKIGDPRKAAFRHLSETRVQAVHATHGTTITQPPYSVRYLGSCLNAYIKGENLRYAKVFNQEGPVNIYGVPSDPSLWW
jgi:hypothetical protein